MSRRLIILVWEEGEPLEIEYEGTFDLWEVKAAFEEALAQSEEAFSDSEEDSE